MSDGGGSGKPYCSNPLNQDPLLDKSLLQLWHLWDRVSFVKGGRSDEGNDGFIMKRGREREVLLWLEIAVV